MDWEKPSPDLIRILEETSAPFASIERRQMFGCPAALDEWMHRSVEFVSSLPPKQPKPKKKGLRI